MSISLCRRISMALVVCICASFCLLPFRSAAGQAEIDNLAEPVLRQWRRLNSILPTDKEEAAQILKTLFVLYDVDASFSSVALEDLEGVAKTFSQIGISAVFKEVALPSGGYGWVLQCDSVESFPANIYGLYAPGGRIIYTPTEEEDDSAATTSRPSYTAPSTNVDIEYTQVFDSTTNTWVDVEINKYDQSVTNNTTNNNHYWDVDNRQFWDVENNTYTTYNDITYNPSTQTYNVQFSDNRTYTYQFYYEYTYITYIGSSAEYREAYKVYYELPDGRSSGDLTVDELKGLSLQFDMVNYDKAASDTLTRILLPFDGSLDSTAYYISTSSLTASAGYSFLESPEPFGGSLFVNSSSSTWAFSSVLADPLSVGNGDGFTLQGRFYIADNGNSNLFFKLVGDFWLPTIIDYDDEGGIARARCMVKNASNGFWFGVQNGNLLVLSSNYSKANNFETDIVDNGSYFSQTLLSGLSPGTWYDFAISCDMPSFMPVPRVYNSTRGIYYLPGFSTLYPSISQCNARLNSYSCKISFYLNGNKVGSLGSDSPYYANQFNSSIPMLSAQSYANTFMYCSSLSGFEIQCRDVNQSSVELDNFRLVSTPLFSTNSYPIPQAPFDTNLVYVLPSVADLNDNTVAIMSQLPVTGYRVGGIRPTDPTLAVGYVWMHVDGDFVDSVQQWNGAYWEEVTARLYTGVRWIPVTAFNVFTLEDMFDIVDPDGDGGGESVSTIYQYYLWWSGEWGTFQQWLQGTMETLIEAIQNSGSGSGGPVTIVPGYNDQTTTNEITTENPDGSTTVTTIVSNAAGLVYSRSVTTWPPDAEGNVTTREVYTDSSGVMYQTTIITDKDGNVTITEPSEATGTLASIFKTITQGVMSIATTVIEAFVDLLVELVGFVLDSVGRIFTGITNILATLLSAITSFVAELGAAAQFLPAFFSILPAPIQSGFTLIFVGCVAIGLFRLIHF